LDNFSFFAILSNAIKQNCPDPGMQVGQILLFYRKCQIIIMILANITPAILINYCFFQIPE